MLGRLAIPSGGRGTDRELGEDNAGVLGFENEGTLRFMAISLSPLDRPVDADGGLGTLRLGEALPLGPLPVAAGGFRKLCGGRGTDRPADPGVAVALPCLCGMRADAVSEPRDIAVPSLRGDAIPVLRVAWFPSGDWALAGGVMRLIVGRENADCEGLAAVSPARAPSTACRLGLASSLPSAEAPLNCAGETLTEFPRTGMPRSRLLRDIAVRALCEVAKRGIPKPFLPYRGVRPPLRKYVFEIFVMLVIRVFLMLMLRK